MAIASALGNLGHLPQSAGARPRLLGALVALEVWLDRHHQRRSLLELDDHILHDIGLSRADVEAEAKKPFWQR
jgi:uncharacterized protein YjiS (DUF1127 family)